MNTSDEVRAMFDAVLISPPPDTTDIDAAMRAGRRRRRRRPAAVVVSLGAVVVAAGVVVASPWTTPAPQPPTAAPSTHAPVTPVADGGHSVASPSELFGVWRVLRLGGRDVSGATGVNGEPLILRFGDDQVGSWWGASDGCNETRGRFAVTPAGQFSATAEVTTAVGCLLVEYPGNPAAVAAADEARTIDANDNEPRRLVLAKDGRELAVYAYEVEVTAP